LKEKGRDDIRLVFIGDGKLKLGLVRRAESETLDNCLFLKPVPKKKLTSLMHGCDAGMMILANVPAFYFGTSPNKFFDYIASGIPVLNNYPGWLAGLVKENECGIAVPPENPEAFADALIVMANDRERTRQMGVNSRVLAESQFDRSDLAEKFCDWLEKAVK
jgi:glycosyltransferase involved in cell wall biosynthesis